MAKTIELTVFLYFPLSAFPLFGRDWSHSGLTELQTTEGDWSAYTNLQQMYVSNPLFCFWVFVVHLVAYLLYKIDCMVACLNGFVILSLHVCSACSMTTT